MECLMSSVQSVIDHCPLSAYVDWAAKRNRDPILDLFKQLFPPSGDALELASGSGAHINYFAPHFPHIRFQPSDYGKGVFETIRQMQAEYANANVWDPVHIDLAKPETGRTPRQIATMLSSQSICFMSRPSLLRKAWRKSPRGS
jgi:uncharacterized protein DUF938